MPSIVLVNDPVANRVFDLRRALGDAAVVIEPTPEAEPAAGEQAGALATACAATAGAPVPLPRYRAQLRSRPSGDRVFAAADTAGALLELASAGFTTVVFVCASTLPLVEALFADDRTRPALRVGLTGWRLDPDYNLAQKLVAQKKLHYHEHGMALERLLASRLELMQRAHAARS